MASEQDSILNELKSRIKLLEKQDAGSGVLMEEKLMLWLVTETIIQSNNGHQLINNMLERISLLLDIPYATCCEIKHGKVKSLA